jgi:23S rRNA-/tRNA-specific pseudouridylate synthase
MKLLHAGIAEKKPWARERNLDYLTMRIRLDAETSGVFCSRKTNPRSSRSAIFSARKSALRKFVALVRGEPAENQFEVDAKLAPHPVKPARCALTRKTARNRRREFEVLENFPRAGYTLLKCDPLTGRTAPDPRPSAPRRTAGGRR